MEFEFLLILSLLCGIVAFMRLYLVRMYEQHRSTWSDTPYHKRILLVNQLFQRILIPIEVIIFLIGLLLLLYSVTIFHLKLFLVSISYIGVFIFLIGWRSVCPISDNEIQELEDVLRGEIEVENMSSISSEEYEKH